MEICRFTGETFPSLGKITSGLAPNYYYLCKYITKYGHTNTLIAGGYPQFPKTELIDNFRVIRIRNRSRDKIFSSIPLNYSAYHILKNIKFDVIHVHNAFGIWLQKKLRQSKKVVLSIHGDLFKRLGSVQSNFALKQNFVKGTDRIKDYIVYKLASKNADHIIAVSNSVKEELINYYDIKEEKITVIHNGFDNKLFHRIKCKKLNELYNCDYSLLYVGSFQPRKGLKYLLNALPKKDNIKLFIVGSDKKVYEDYLNYLIKKYNVSKQVVLLGKIPYTKLFKVYSSADCFVFPTLSEGLPKVLLESLACECPVIATNVSGNPEVIKSEKTGLLVPSRDSRAFTGAISWALKNQKEMQKMARSGREKVVREFTWEIAAKKYAQVYENLYKY